MIKIQNIQQHSKQIFQIFTEEDWLNQKVNHPNIDFFFTGKKDEFFIKTDSDNITFFIGIGNNAQNFDIQAVAKKFAYNYRKSIQPEASTIISNLTTTQLEQFVKGLFLGTYQYPFKEEHPFWNTEFFLQIDNISESEVQEIVIKTTALCKGQFAGMEWLNKPANFKKVEQISDYLKEISKEYNFKYTVFNRQQCIENGLGAFAAVNQGSNQDAAFTIIEYNCGDPNAKTFGLIGKCVLFDTGGISIKPSSNLHYMKSDMGGASAVIGTLITAAEQKTKTNIIAILPITDNAVSEKAYLPSDVVTAYNGKTIEVIDTDAEGRMTLADALSYLSQNYETDILIDLATLTGSAVRMFGYTCAAYFSNNKELKHKLETAADKTNQRIWNLPLWDVWKEDFLSDVADFKNISLKPFGDCIIAAKFLEQFTNEHPNWAHLDIAGVAFGNVAYAKEKAATGYGVQLLTEFIENYEDI